MCQYFETFYSSFVFPVRNKLKIILHCSQVEHKTKTADQFFIKDLTVIAIINGGQQSTKKIRSAR